MQTRGKNIDNLMGSPRRALLTMSLPLLFALIVENLQSFIDGVWCSGLGSDAMSAISLSHPIYAMIARVGTGIGIGASAAIARFIGAGDSESAGNAASVSILLSLLLSILMTVCLWFAAEPIISFCSNGENLELCMEYTRPILTSSFFLTMNAVWAGMLRAEGAARRSMFLSITASIVNIILDPILIYGLDLGVTGASLATCISFIVITAIGFWWYLSGKTYVRLDTRRFRMQKAALVEVLIIAVPCIIEMIIQPIIMVPQNAIIYDAGGEEGFVSYIYSFRFVTITLIPVVAISKSLIPIVSAGMGAKKPDMILESCRLAYKYTLIFEAFCTVFILITADYLVMAFMGSESMMAIHDQMTLALRIFSLTCVLHTFRILGNSIMQATRHAATSSALTIAREFVFLIGFAIAANMVFEAIYWSCIITNFVMMFIITLLAKYYLKDMIERMHEDEIPKTTVRCDLLSYTSL